MHTNDELNAGRGSKVAATLALVGVIVLGAAGIAGATPPPDAVSVATSAGTEFKDVGLSVIVALVPLAVALIVAKRAFNMARGWVG